MLTSETIALAGSDTALIDLISSEIRRLIPSDTLGDDVLFHAAVKRLPRGLRAMQGIYQLDVSMAMDDLAWHFLNHPSEEATHETLGGLRELELPAVAGLFQQACDIWAPHIAAYREVGLQGVKRRDFLAQRGIQTPIDPLNDELWAIIGQMGDHGLLQAWATYARKYPDRCIAAS